MTEEPGSSQPRSWNPRRLGLNAVVLGVCWLILSGHYDAFHLVLGLFSVGLVLWLNRSDFRTLEHPPSAARLRLGRVILYTCWLAKEMVVSALQVARVVLSPKLNVQPGLVRFRSDQPNELSRVILGNSITLTPGTLTVDIDAETFLIHHLTAATAEDLLSGSMQRRVAELFGPVRGTMVAKVERPDNPEGQ